MEKVKKFILSVDFTMLVFILIGIRIAVYGATVGDAIAIAAICGCQFGTKAFNQWIDTKKQQPLNDQVTKDLEDIKASMAGIMLRNTVRPPQSPSAERVAPKFF